MIGAYHISAATLYHLSEFQTAREYAVRGVQIWRSGAVLSPVEDVETAPVCCLCYEAVLDWHFGEIASCKAKMAEAIALAKKLNDMFVVAKIRLRVSSRFETGAKAGVGPSPLRRGG
jgi:hypothetical protein